ncbi:MAG TPA: hypothetical protein DCY91_08965 [Cyanobacteria bacterium UBA11370]|nr:hypothetical protein [Cyanobacteria bacterium UBA11370]HBY79783.1 hypothetical protein [Cyanobacteria bacterium UBA11148]
MKPQTTSSETLVSILSAAVVSGGMLISFLFGFSLCYFLRAYAINRLGNAHSTKIVVEEKLPLSGQERPMVDN